MFFLKINKFLFEVEWGIGPIGHLNLSFSGLNQHIDIVKVVYDFIYFKHLYII